MKLLHSVICIIYISYCTASTIIIVEDAKACFRRVLAGKRVARRFVKRALTCERIEDCQQECSEEKRFVCEGFNYRLDPTGRAKGECELLDVPITHLDIGRDLYPDTDYDYYERDRNSAPDCKRRQPSYDGYGGSHGGNYGSGYGGNYGGNFGGSYGGSYGGGYGGGYGGSSVGGYGNGYDNTHYGGHRRYDHYDDRYDGKRPSGGGGDYGGRPTQGGSYGDRRPGGGYYDEGYKPYPDKPGGDYYHQHSHHSQHEYENSQSYHFNYHINSNKNDHHQQQEQHGYHYPSVSYLPDNNRYKPSYHPPQQQYDHKSYEPYLPPNRRYDVVPPSYDDGDRYMHNYYYDREKDRNYWGFDKNEGGWGSYGGSYGNFGRPVSHYPSDYYWQHKNHNRHDYDYDHYYNNHYYLPPQVGGNKDWGQYGGSYGTGGHNNYHNNQHDRYDYWGLDRYHNKFQGHGQTSVGFYYGETPPYKPQKGGYSPGETHRGFHDYDRNYYNNGGSSFNTIQHGGYIGAPPGKNLWNGGNNYNFIRDECSLRSATGFRLHKGIVKKYFAVPSIYECELLCFKEKEFRCNSFAFRYTIASTTPSDNCFLSNRNYKELDYYTDLEPDRNFDIYTMNNPSQCGQTTMPSKSHSECFWRVRSGLRLDHKIVRDSLNAKSIVECEVECLKSVRFICRAFSFRYGSAVIGGSIDNCQLTDWPFYELDATTHLVPETGFELYERGSYGHGCEPNHFKIPGRHRDKGIQVDQLCYVGFGTPARLLPQATKKSLAVESELDCKAECSRYREGTLFQCMSFSFKTTGQKNLPNCFLSDILQRDLLSNVDYVRDPDSWLFAWDNYNPQCIALANEPLHDANKNPNIKNDGDKNRRIESRLDPGNALDTWRIYSVSGWPCRRGTSCQENRAAGFWFCELEGGDKDSWDYCCRPDHHCGFSEDYPYQWCYVGPVNTQWRKCSDRYYPYFDNYIDRHDNTDRYRPPEHKDPWIQHQHGGNNIPDIRPPPYRPGGRPERPPAPSTPQPQKPSLDEYEMQFDSHFLDPPKPGGFGQPRRWPVSYLHKEMPPNATTVTSPKFEQMKMDTSQNPKHSAIQSLIDIIKSNDLKNIEYQITNESNKADDILFVKIPLPTNFTRQNKSAAQKLEDATDKLEPIDLEVTSNVTSGQNRIDRASRVTDAPSVQDTNFASSQRSEPEINYQLVSRSVPVYRRAFITKTNVTTHGRRAKILREFS